MSISMSKNEIYAFLTCLLLLLSRCQVSLLLNKFVFPFKYFILDC